MNKVTAFPILPCLLLAASIASSQIFSTSPPGGGIYGMREIQGVTYAFGIYPFRMGEDGGWENIKGDGPAILAINGMDWFGNEIWVNNDFLGICHTPPDVIHWTCLEEGSQRMERITGSGDYLFSIKWPYTHLHRYSRITGLWDSLTVGDDDNQIDDVLYRDGALYLARYISDGSGRNVLMVSRDGGLTLTPDLSIPNPDKFTACNDSAFLLAGGRRWVYRLQPGGWLYLGGPGAGADGNLLCNDNGLYMAMRGNEGALPTLWKHAGDTLWTLLDVVPPSAGDGTFFAGGPFLFLNQGRNDFFRSRDGGKTWEDIGGLISSHLIERALFGESDIFLRAYWNPHLFRLGAEGLWSVEIPAAAAGGESPYLSKFGIKNGVLYAGINNGALFTSADKGLTWEPFSQPLYTGLYGHINFLHLGAGYLLVGVLGLVLDYPGPIG